MATVLVGGVAYNWANATLMILGQPLIGITKMSIKEKQVKENGYGIGNEPVYRQYGNVEYEGSLTVYFEEIARIIDAVANGKITSIPFFDAPLNLVSTKNVPRTLIIRSMEFLECNFDVSQGDTKVLVDLPFVLGGITWKQQ